MIGTWNMFRKGAIDYVDGFFVDRDGKKVRPKPIVSLAEAFSDDSANAACATYSYSDRFVRFTGTRAMYKYSSPAYVRWLHVDYDLEKVKGRKQWPWVIESRTGIQMPFNRHLSELIVQLRIGVLHMSSWYFTRGGLHFVQQIEALKYQDALAYLQAALKQLPKEVVGPWGKIVLDPTCAQPGRLMYLPRARKIGIGTQELPMEVSYNPAVRLPEPTWLGYATDTIKGKQQVTLHVSDTERLWVENFATRWLLTHVRWLATAKPGSGRNSRLYAFGGDIRQFADAGLLEAEEWLEYAMQCGRTAPEHPVHNLEQAVLNGYSQGQGTHTLAVAVSDLQKLHVLQERNAKLEEALCRPRLRQ